jgi:hypothetical protein
VRIYSSCEKRELLIFDLEIFDMEIVNGRWNGHDDEEITIEENGGFRGAEEDLVWFSLV